MTEEDILDGVSDLLSIYSDSRLGLIFSSTILTKVPINSIQWFLDKSVQHLKSFQEEDTMVVDVVVEENTGIENQCPSGISLLYSSPGSWLKQSQMEKFPWILKAISSITMPPSLDQVHTSNHLTPKPCLLLRPHTHKLTQHHQHHHLHQIIHKSIH